jgi:NADP-dependent 3-hydroxy acid dehydrogenase YdfG
VVSVKPSPKNLLMKGACIIVNDNDAERLATAKESFQKEYGKDVFTTVLLDVTSRTDIENAFETAAFLLAVLILW